MSGPAALSVDLIFGCRSRLRDPDLRYDLASAGVMAARPARLLRGTAAPRDGMH